MKRHETLRKEEIGREVFRNEEIRREATRKISQYTLLGNLSYKKKYQFQKDNKVVKWENSQCE